MLFLAMGIFFPNDKVFISVAGHVGEGSITCKTEDTIYNLFLLLLLYAFPKLQVLSSIKGLGV